MTYLRRTPSRSLAAMQSDMDRFNANVDAVLAHNARPHDAYEQIQAAAALGVLDRMPDAAELALPARHPTKP